MDQKAFEICPLAQLRASEKKKKQAFIIANLLFARTVLSTLKNINSFNPHNKQPLEVCAFIISIFTDEKNCKQFARGHITNKRWSQGFFPSCLTP